MKICLPGWILVCSLLSPLATFSDNATLRLAVLDADGGGPLDGVGVTATFINDAASSWGKVNGTPKCDERSGSTDRKGMCLIRGNTNCGRVVCAISKGPLTHYWHGVRGSITFDCKSFFGEWMPDDSVVTLRVQRVENPIPLKAKMITVDGAIGDTCRSDAFASGGGVLKYDMLIGDWLSPLGNGKTCDILFELKSGIESNGEATEKGKCIRDVVEVSFPGEGNGVVEVPVEGRALKVRKAPETGYRSEPLRLTRERGADGQWRMPRRNDSAYCFRIRTRIDRDGNLSDGYYGKIYGDPMLLRTFADCTKTGGVRMGYYLNPKSLDRNLEYDMNNLFPIPRDSCEWYHNWER